MSTVCSHCGCADVEVDQTRGDTVCTSCGSVLEDQRIVSEVQFQEAASGAASVIGQFVSSDGNKEHSLGSSFQHGFGKESKAETLQKAKRRFQNLGGILKLNQHCIDTAMNFFKMAYVKKLTRTRKSSHVVAACVYLVCRTEGLPHMLLDISDALQVNVYTLGRTYLTLSRQLCINIPAIDPCLYIPRFAHRLEFGDKTHEVSMTALRLVQRMKRDWMSTGRRPSGLCGSALLVAARLHEFSRSLKDIIRVVKVCQNTIKKRLCEFGATASSKLTIDEFQRIDLETEHDPPAYIEGKKKTKFTQLEEGKISELTAEVDVLQEEIQQSLLQTNRQSKLTDVTLSDTGQLKSATGRLESDSEQEESDAELSENDTMQSQSNRKQSQSDTTQSLGDATQSLSDMTQSLSDMTQSLSDAMQSQTDKTQSQGDMTQSAHISEIESADDIRRIENEEMSRLLGDTDVTYLGPRPSAASLGIRESVIECLHTNTTESFNKTGETEDGELDLTGIDDAELDKFILTEDEARVKTSVWMNENADYLREMREKREREEKEAEENTNKTKRKRPRRSKAPIQAKTANEAIEQMLQQKKISNKINYDVLKDLKGSNPLPVIEESPARSVAGDAPLSRFRKPTQIIASPRSLQTKPTRSISKGPTFSPLLHSSSPVKRQRLTELPDTNSPTVPTVLVESGPVQYAGGTVEDDEIEEDDEDDDDEPVGASHLFGNMKYGEYEDDNDLIEDLD